MSNKTVTGRTPSQPELQSLKSEQAGDMLKAFREKHPDCHAKFWAHMDGAAETANANAEQFFIDVLSGKRAPAAKGRFSAKSCQPQNIPRSALVNMDYAEIERRVTGMHPALGAPYGQSEEDKTNG